MSKTKNNVGVNPAKIVANMSASILRSIVATIFKINPSTVKLSGEIGADASFTGNTCWSAQTTETRYQLWGFNPMTGLINLSEYVGNSRNRQDGTQDVTEATRLCDIPGVSDFVFFIVNDETRCYDDSRSSNDWTIFKAPNFKEYFEKVTAKDIQRWSQWIEA